MNINGINHIEFDFKSIIIDPNSVKVMQDKIKCVNGIIVQGELKKGFFMIHPVLTLRYYIPEDRVLAYSKL